MAPEQDAPPRWRVPRRVALPRMLEEAERAEADSIDFAATRAGAAEASANQPPGNACDNPPTLAPRFETAASSVACRAEGTETGAPPRFALVVRAGSRVCRAAAVSRMARAPTPLIGPEMTQILSTLRETASVQHPGSS